MGKISKCVGLFFGVVALVEGKGEELLQGRDAPEIPTTYKCPDGFFLEGTLCVKTILHKPKAICESGRLVGNECVKWYSATMDCPPDYDWRGDKCVKVSEIVPTASCPSEYILDGVNCVTSKYIEPVCPLGTAEQNNLCAMHHATSKRCPAGFTNTSSYHKYGRSNCLKTNVMPPAEMCYEPFTLNAVGNSCELIKKETPVCPYGTTEEGHKCAIYKAAEIKCKDEYVLSQGKCMKQFKEKPIPSCQDGYVLTADERCEKSIALEPVCSGELKEVADGRCAAYHSAKPQCAEGFGLSYKDGQANCKKAVRIAASVVCSEGYEVQGSNCVKSVKSPMVCPAGSRSVDDKCEISKSAMAKCRVGFQRNGSGKCFNVERMEQRASCTKDFVMSDKPGICEKSKVCEAISVCRKGAREGDNCVSYSNSTPSYVCPAGFVEEKIGEKTRCVHRVNKDCSTVEYKVQCHDVPTCFTKECEEKVKATRALTGIGNFRQRALPYETKQICEKVAINHPKTCEKTLYADARIACSAGSIAKGNGCIVTTYHEPSMECPTGEYDEMSKLCVKMYTKAAVYSCPEDFNKSVGGRKCSKVVYDSLMYHCKDGSELKGKKCTKFVTKVCEGGQCDRMVAVLADIQCPDGFHVSQGAEEEGGSHGVCVMDETTAAIYVCKLGELVDGRKCAKYHTKVCPGGTCERKTYSKVKQECLEGYSLVQPSSSHSHKLFSGTHSHGRQGVHIHAEAECVKTSYEAAQMFCSKASSTLVQSKCVKYVEKKCLRENCQSVVMKAISYECPKGYTKQKDYDAHSQTAPMIDRFILKDKRQKHRIQPMQIKCVSNEVAPFEHFCSKGEMVDGKSCAKYFKKACPNNQCEVKVSVGPQYTCAEGYKMIPSMFPALVGQVNLCQAIIYEDAMYRCPKGESDETGRRCKKNSQPKQLCPRGSNRANGMCVTKHVEKPSIVFAPYYA